MVASADAGTPGFDEALAATDAPDRCEAWRAEFDASAGWVRREAVQLPEGKALLELCSSLGFPQIATDQLVEQRETWNDARIRRLGAHVQWLISNRYSPAGYHGLGWAPVFSRCPLFYAYAALGLARQIAAEQSARGVDGATTRATLWDIGQQVYLHHRVHGEVGMHKGWWLSHHLSHHLYRLGRLQFQRARSPAGLGRIAASEPFLDVHIPEDGPVDPAGCDRSFEQAAAFFSQHFAEEPVRFYACTSWLLDPTLAGLLPDGSNILRFQRRFERHELRDGPSGVFEFVFDRPDLDRASEPDLAGLPRDTRLRTAIIEHYARGGVIRRGVGTIPMLIS